MRGSVVNLMWRKNHLMCAKNMRPPEPENSVLCIRVSAHFNFALMNHSKPLWMCVCVRDYVNTGIWQAKDRRLVRHGISIKINSRIHTYMYVRTLYCKSSGIDGSAVGSFSCQLWFFHSVALGRTLGLRCVMKMTTRQGTIAKRR